VIIDTQYYSPFSETTSTIVRSFEASGLLLLHCSYWLQLWLQLRLQRICWFITWLSLTYPILSNRCIQNDPVHTNAAAFIAHFRYLNALETHVIRIYIIVKCLLELQPRISLVKSTTSYQSFLRVPPFCLSCVHQCTVVTYSKSWTTVRHKNISSI